MPIYSMINSRHLKLAILSVSKLSSFNKTLLIIYNKLSYILIIHSYVSGLLVANIESSGSG